MVSSFKFLSSLKVEMGSFYLGDKDNYVVTRYQIGEVSFSPISCEFLYEILMWIFGLEGRAN